MKVSKYFVKMEAKDVTSSETKNVTYSAISSANAREIANMFNKNFEAMTALRLDKNATPVEKAITNIAEAYAMARRTGEEMVALELREEYDEAVAEVKKNLSVTAFNLAVKRIPELVKF